MLAKAGVSREVSPIAASIAILCSYKATDYSLNEPGEFRMFARSRRSVLDLARGLVMRNDLIAPAVIVAVGICLAAFLTGGTYEFRTFAEHPDMVLRLNRVTGTLAICFIGDNGSGCRDFPQLPRLESLALSTRKKPESSKPDQDPLAGSLPYKPPPVPSDDSLAGWITYKPADPLAALTPRPESSPSSGESLHKPTTSAR